MDWSAIVHGNNIVSLNLTMVTFFESLVKALYSKLPAWLEVYGKNELLVQYQQRQSRYQHEIFVHICKGFP